MPLRLSALANALHARLTTHRQRRRLRRSMAVRARFMRLTGFPVGRRGWQIDHVIPLALGGPDSTDNMQWLPTPVKHAKDRLERRHPPLPHPATQQDYDTLRAWELSLSPHPT